MDNSKMKPGKKSPEEVTVIVEIPQGSSIKYELDKESGVVMVDRFLFTAMFYPFNYGFVPGTLTDDGDPVDILVLSSQPIAPGCGIVARPIGMLEMEDEEGLDAKIIAVPTAKVDPFYGKITSVDDLDDSIKQKIQHFFNNYKTLEPGKWIKTKNFVPKERAYEEITKSTKK
jgi:inorganic pyrophosphatase